MRHCLIDKKVLINRKKVILTKSFLVQEFYDKWEEHEENIREERKTALRKPGVNHTQNIVLETLSGKIIVKPLYWRSGTRYTI